MTFVWPTKATTDLATTLIRLHSPQATILGQVPPKYVAAIAKNADNHNDSENFLTLSTPTSAAIDHPIITNKLPSIKTFDLSHCWRLPQSRMPLLMTQNSSLDHIMKNVSLARILAQLRLTVSASLSLHATERCCPMN